LRLPELNVAVAVARRVAVAVVGDTTLIGTALHTEMAALDQGRVKEFRQ
jgi:hypothetical protein